MSESKRYNGSAVDMIFHDPFAAIGTPQSQPFPKEPARGGQPDGGKKRRTRESRQEAKALALSQVARDLQNLMKTQAEQISIR